jgi:hypothetical protein
VANPGLRTIEPAVFRTATSRPNRMNGSGRPSIAAALWPEGLLYFAGSSFASVDSSKTALESHFKPATAVRARI